MVLASTPDLARFRAWWLDYARFYPVSAYGAMGQQPDTGVHAASVDLAHHDVV